MKEYFREMFTYEQWAGEEIIRTFQPLDQSLVPVRARVLFSHILSAQRIWFYRLTQQKIALNVWQEYPLNEWKEILHANIGYLMGIIENLNPIELQRVISYSNSQGEPFESTVQEVLTHIPIHSGYHRGQIIVLIKPICPQVPLTDYIHYARKIKNN